jgi:apolipoprotein N-acyltransferase
MAGGRARAWRDGGCPSLDSVKTLATLVRGSLPADQPARRGIRLAIRLWLAGAAGGLLALSMPPRGWWPLAVVSIAVLCIALYWASWRSRLAVGFAAGAAFFIPTLTWLIEFSPPGAVVVVIVEVALFALAIALVPAGVGGWWTLPAALVVLEAVRARFPVGGFPIPGIALSQLDGPFAGTAGLGGSLLVVALVGITGVGIAALYLTRHQHGWRRFGAAALAGVIVATALGVSTLPFTRQTGQLTVATIQGGGPRGIPAVLSDPQRVTDRHFDVAKQIHPPVDLVVWPEAIINIDERFATDPDARRTARLARRLETTVVAGVAEPSGSGGFRNAALSWNSEGRVMGRYDKVHRVPFGEYIPMRWLFERLSDATALVPRDAVPGHGPGVLASPEGRLGVVISFEVFFSDRARAAAAGGGQLLLVPTNAASYTTEEVPATEVAAARMRALEIGRSVVQAAPTGYSAIVAPDAEVMEQSRLEEPAVLDGTVSLRTGQTPYVRTGDWPLIAIAVLVLTTPCVTARIDKGALLRTRR